MNCASGTPRGPPMKSRRTACTWSPRTRPAWSAGTASRKAPERTWPTAAPPVPTRRNCGPVSQETGNGSRAAQTPTTRRPSWPRATRRPSRPRPPARPWGLRRCWCSSTDPAAAIPTAARLRSSSRGPSATATRRPRPIPLTVTSPTASTPPCCRWPTVPRPERPRSSSAWAPPRGSNWRACRPGCPWCSTARPASRPSC
jgi:hypothetical protein